MFPVRPLLAMIATVLLAGCGANPYGAGYDAYGNPIDPYSSAYGSSYGTDYSSSYGSDYSSSYGSDYSSSYGSSYGGSYGTGTTGGSYGDYGSSYGDDSVIKKNSTTTQAPVVLESQVLSAWVTDFTSASLMNRLLGTGKVSAKVEVENPSSRTLSGRLKVVFLKDGDPSGVAQFKTLTLAPKEKQVLTFSASNGKLDDAEASIETTGAGSAPAPSAGGGVVVDREVKKDDDTTASY